MSFSNSEICRLSEGLEAEIQALFATRTQEIKPEIGAVSIPFAGGQFTWAGPESFASQAIGIGVGNDPNPDANHLAEALKAFYVPLGIAPSIELASLAPWELHQGLQDNGFRLAELSHFMALDLTQAPAQQSLPEGYAIEPVTPELAERTAKMLSTAFGVTEPASAAAAAFFFQTWISLPGTQAYCVMHQSEPVAAGVVTARGPLAVLSGGATLPQFRGKGLQTALLLHRVSVARTAGCSMATVGAGGGTISERNAMRVGFRLAYARLKWQLPIAN